MEKNEKDPPHPEQNKTVGHQWGMGQTVCEHCGGHVGEHFHFCPLFEDRLPIDQDPSWWVKHWESGEDLHFNDDYMGTYHPTPNTAKLTIRF